MKVIGKEITGKISTHIFTCKLDDEIMNNEIINQIDLQGDKQNFKTNAKAQMTDWFMQDKPGFKELADIMINVSTSISKQKFHRDIKPFIYDMWGIKYVSEQEMLEHDHYPNLWSAVYYVNPSQDATELTFPEFDYKIKPENGLLVIFPSMIRHKVVKKSFEGVRYVVSANIAYK